MQHASGSNLGGYVAGSAAGAFAQNLVGGLFGKKKKPDVAAPAQAAPAAQHGAPDAELTTVAEEKAVMPTTPPEMFPELKTVRPPPVGTAELVMLAVFKAWTPVELTPVPAMVPELVRLTVSVAKTATEATPVDEMTPALVTLAVVAAMPALVPVMVPLLVLVTVRVAASKMPKAPPERNTELVQVWLAPAVTH